MNELLSQIPRSLVSQIAAVGVFFGTAFFVWIVGRLFLRPRDPRRRLRRPPVFGPFTGLLAHLPPVLPLTGVKIDHELRQAGYYHQGARHDFLAIRNALIWGVLVLSAMVLNAEKDASFSRRRALMIVAGVSVLIAYAAPRLILQSQAAKRVGEIVTGLPDVLDMMTMAVAGGATLHESLDRVTPEIRSVHPRLAEELELIRKQGATGTLDGALGAFAHRIDHPELRSLAALVGQSERLGVGVGAALRDYADGVRHSHRQRAEERGNRASVKLILPVIFCLAPPVYILLLGPALLELKGFVQRENSPGGILQPVDPNQPPSVSADQLARNARTSLERSRNSIGSGSFAPLRTPIRAAPAARPAPAVRAGGDR